MSTPPESTPPEPTPPEPTPPESTPSESRLGPGRRRRAADALTGLSVGDAFGELFFPLLRRRRAPSGDPPPPPWPWTDDTEMACSVVDVLHRYGGIEQDALAEAFAARFDAGRNYGAGALRLLERIRAGEPWRTASAGSFGGTGSFGNGAAMRVPPLGAWFAGEPGRAASEAAASAEVTHAHPEGVAGAVAVAVATSLAAAHRPAAELIDAVLDHLPAGQVRRGLERARALGVCPPERAARELGNGSRITAPDTVPFTLWAAARHLDDYEAAVRSCVAAGGDMDTTAAIVGGIVAARLGAEAVPAAWREAREPLPSWLSPP